MSSPQEQWEVERQEQVKAHREQEKLQQQKVSAIAEQRELQSPTERKQQFLLAEEQVLGIAMNMPGERGMSGLRALDPEDFCQRPVHAVIARNIMDLADRGYRHDPNAVSKLAAIRGQKTPWDFRGPLQRMPDGRVGVPPTSGYLQLLRDYAQPYQTGMYFAAQVRDGFRQDYAVQTGELAQRLGSELAATAGREDPWSLTERLETFRRQLTDRIDACPPSLQTLLKTSVGHDRLQKTLTVVPSLKYATGPALGPSRPR